MTLLMMMIIHVILSVRNDGSDWKEHSKATIMCFAKLDDQNRTTDVSGS